jgi:hypothetical protein
MLIKPHKCTHSHRYAAAIHRLGKHATILPFRRPRISPYISPRRFSLKSPSVSDLPPSCRRFPEACLGFRLNCSSLETFCGGARVSRKRVQGLHEFSLPFAANALPVFPLARLDYVVSESKICTPARGSIQRKFRTGITTRPNSHHVPESDIPVHQLDDASMCVRVPAHLDP